MVAATTVRFMQWRADETSSGSKREIGLEL